MLRFLLAIAFSLLLSSIFTQNFPDGYTFPLSSFDTTEADFLPPFSIAPLSATDQISTSTNGTFQANGAPIRFWGVNLSAAGNFPEKSEAPMIAKRMAKMGINLVRLHHLDNPSWFGSNSSIFMNNGDTRTINPIALDKLDFLVAELKKNGIYINLNLNVSRTFQAGDGVAAADSIQDFGKAITLYDPWMRFLQKEFAEQILTHINPYTGIALANDPVLAMVETNNENTLYGYWRGDYLTTYSNGGILPVYYNDVLDNLWWDWLGTKYDNSTRNIADAWNQGVVPAGFDEKIGNGGFETGMLNPEWISFGQNGGVVSTVASTDADAGGFSAEVTAIALGTNNYDIQFYHTGLELKKDTTYTLFFRAKALADLDISTLVQIDAPPYTTYGLELFSLTTEWQTFEILFTPTEDTNLGKVGFFPEAVGTFYLDAVSLRPLYQAPNSSLVNDQVINGGFETGLAAPWELEVFDVASATFAAGNQAQSGSFGGSLDVTSVSGTDWHLQLKQAGGTVQKDSTYQITFYARVESGTAEASLTLMRDNDPFTWYTGWTFYLTDQWQAFSYSFTAPEVNLGNFRISFSPLQNVNTFHFDNVAFGNVSPTGFVEGESLQGQSISRILYSTRTDYSDRRISDLMQFYTETEKAHLDSMYMYVKNDLNVQVPVTGSNALVGHQDVYRHKDMDYIDDHAYWDHPSFPGSAFDPNDFTISNTPMVKSQYFDAMANIISGFSMADKPYTLSEYNHAAPNRFRTEMVPIMAAYAGFHGVDGIMFFEYETDFDWDNDVVNGFFSLNQDHSVMSQFPSAAYAYRMGYIAEDANPITIDYNEYWVYKAHKFDNRGRWGFYLPYDARIGLEHAVHTGNFDNPTSPDFTVLPAVPTNGSYTTSTQETALDTQTGIVKTDTEKYASITGFLQDAPNTQTAQMELISASDFGAITWLSLDDTPLGKSQKSLLTISSVQQNTNMLWDGATSLDDWGQSPTMIKPLQLTLRLQNEADFLCIYPLNAQGDSISTCTPLAPVSSGVFDLVIDQSIDQTMWYGILAKNTTSIPATPKCFSVRIQPNPTSDILYTNLNLKESDNVSITIHSLEGKIVQEKNFGKKTPGTILLKTSLKKLPVGMYFYTIKVGSNREVRKVHKVGN